MRSRESERVAVRDREGTGHRGRLLVPVLLRWRRAAACILRWARGDGALPVVKQHIQMKARQGVTGPWARELRGERKHAAEAVAAGQDDLRLFACVHTVVVRAHRAAHVMRHVGIIPVGSSKRGGALGARGSGHVVLAGGLERIGEAGTTVRVFHRVCHRDENAPICSQRRTDGFRCHESLR